MTAEATRDEIIEVLGMPVLAVDRLHSIMLPGVLAEHVRRRVLLRTVKLCLPIYDIACFGDQMLDRAMADEYWRLRHGKAGCAPSSLNATSVASQYALEVADHDDQGQHGYYEASRLVTDVAAHAFRGDGSATITAACRAADAAARVRTYHSGSNELCDQIVAYTVRLLKRRGNR